MKIGEAKQVPQLNVVLEQVPGSLAKVTEALQRADVNIDGLCNIEGSDDTVPLKLLVDKPEVAKKVIEALGSPVTIEQCIAIQLLEDMPGFIALIARTLGDAKINITSIYQTSSGRGSEAVVYITVDPSNTEKALELLKAL
jgi:hypothetical protein